MSPLSRRSLVLGSSALLMAGCARGPAPLVTPTASPTGPVRDQLQQVMEVYARNADQFGVSVKDLRSGATWGFRGDQDGQNASMAKVMIVLMALTRVRAEGTALTFEQYGWASRAIIDSDNDSADALWKLAGGRDAYARLASTLGMRGSRPDDRSEFWSWTHTTPDDQRLLVELLLRGHQALHVEDRMYLLDLMGKTNPKQTWGVGHDKAKDVHVQMKNGWVQFKSLDNLWAVNSMGHVEGKGRDYVAAIMCRRASFDEGRQLVDAVGADLFRILGSGELR